MRAACGVDGRMRVWAWVKSGGGRRKYMGVAIERGLISVGGREGVNMLRGGGLVKGSLKV